MASTAATLATLLILMTIVSADAAPGNDACVDATTVVAGTRLHDTVDPTDATTAPDDPLQSCTTGGPAQNAQSIWYRLTPPSPGILSVYTYSASLPDDPSTIVSVHTGACGALTEVACDDHENLIGSYLHTDVSAGSDYWIEVARAPGAADAAIEVVVYFDPDSPICPHDGGDFAIRKTTLVLGNPPGHDSRVALNARAELRSALPDVAASGMQLLVEDDANSYASIVEWSARTLAVPAGPPGSGCAPKDGWIAAANGKSFRYRNVSNALPPTCAAGSANGLSDVRLKRRADDPRAVDVKVKARGTAFATTLAGVESVRLSVTFEAAIGAGNVDRCAASFFPLACKADGGGNKLVCR